MEPSESTQRQGASRLLSAWVLVALLALSLGLAGTALFEPDEGRNAEIAREMLESGDFFVPHLNGLPFLDKPPLYFAASAVAMSVLGATELAARLPAFLCALALAGLAAAFAAHLFGPRAAWIAGIATASTPLLVAFSRISIFDTMLSLFMVLAVTCFYRAIEASRALRRDGKALPGFSPRSWSALAWGAVAAGVLTKGPVALAVPLLVAVPYAAWRKEWRPIWNPWGLLVFVALVAPWLVAVERQEPGFLHYALVIETWKRLTTDEMRRTGPVWYFVPYLMGGAFPWSIVAAAGWLRSRTERSGAGDARHRWVFLALWLALPFLLFSFSQSKRPQYILPLIPALTITVAGLWSGRAEPDDESPRSSSFLPGKVAASVVFMILGAALTLAGVAMDSEAFGVDGSILPLARRSAIVLGLFCLAGGFGAWRSRRWTTAVIGLSAPVILFPLAVGPLVSAVADSRSSRHLAELVRSQPEGSGSVAVFEHFPLSLPFYLGHTVDFVTEDAVALRSGFVERSYAQLLARPDSTLRDHDWWYRTVAACPSPYVLLVPERYQDQMAILEASGRENLGGDEEMSVFGPCRQRLRPAPEETGGREE